MARDGSTAAEATARIEAQMPLAEKMRRADLIIDNDGASAPEPQGSLVAGTLSDAQTLVRETRRLLPS